MKDFELKAWFGKILHELDIINAKVSEMPQVHVQVSSRDLPTINALEKLGRPAMASEIAEITGRERATESQILNELVRRGLLLKEKHGHRKVFRIKDEEKR